MSVYFIVIPSGSQYTVQTSGLNLQNKDPWQKKTQYYAVVIWFPVTLKDKISVRAIYYI